jgi:hypothetical protein
MNSDRKRIKMEKSIMSSDVEYSSLERSMARAIVIRKTANMQINKTACAWGGLFLSRFFNRGNSKSYDLLNTLSNKIKPSLSLVPG